jgi:predicted nucleic acid-binding protein
MQIVIDANPLMSILIKPGKPVQLLFMEEIELAAQSLLLDELHRNVYLITQKSKLTNDEIIRFLTIIKKRIKVIPEEEFISFRKKAEEICPDKKDVTYFALALYLKCPIWSNEKVLKEQKDVKVYATHELMKLLGI